MRISALSTRFLLVLAIATAARTAPSAGMAYTLTFGGDSPLPTSGSFTYDAGTRTFSNFVVTWRGHTYDVTAAANSPYFVADPCNGLTGGAAAFLALNGGCNGGTALLYWIAGNQPSVPRSYLGFAAGQNPPGLEFVVDGPALGSDETVISGNVSVTPMTTPPTPTPLPTSAVFGLTGIGGLALWHLGRRTRRIAVARIPEA